MLKRVLALLGFVVITSLAYSQSVTQTFPVTVDYGRSLERMIEDGKYDWASPYINEKNFPVEGKNSTELNIELIQFNRKMSSAKVLSELNKRGLRPANPRELLAFGATYPEKQCESTIVALSSVWRSIAGYRFVVASLDCTRRRDLGLSWLGCRWAVYSRFAAVRK